MNKGSILITGGAGYIGSHVVKALVDKDYSSIVVLDNLSTGFADAVQGAEFVKGDVRDTELLENLFKTYSFDTVMHFAACTVIPESIARPIKYYENNTLGTLALLKAATEHKVKHFIFSSTAAVYDIRPDQIISESAPINPSTPYGRSKWMSEEIIKDICSGHHIRYAILRYFNVAGASPCGGIGQKTKNASHLIKVAVETACDLHPYLSIFGTDYPTLDGTCVRDYIHVSDLADAHLHALAYLKEEGTSLVLNCGYGKGYTVLEVINALEMVCGKKIKTKKAPRRAGDLAIVVADSTRLTKTLNWKPRFDDLEFIVKTAYQYQVILSKAKDLPGDSSFHSE